DRLPNVVVLLGPSPSGRGRRGSRQADVPGEGHKFDEDLKPSSFFEASPFRARASRLRAASPRGRGMLMLQNLCLPEVFHRLRRCRAYIGNDSGITHLAAYLCCPTIALHGPTDPREWRPIDRRARNSWKCTIEDLTLDEDVHS